MKTQQPAAVAANEKPKRIRSNTPFDEAKRAQEKLEALEMKRRAVLEELSDEAAALLEALEELRAKQPIEVAPSSPETTTPLTR